MDMMAPEAEGTMIHRRIHVAAVMVAAMAMGMARIRVEEIMITGVAKITIVSGTTIIGV